VESPGLLVAQRNSGTVDADLEGIAPERSAQEHELGPFDETQDHQPLNGRIGGLDRIDSGAITGLEVGECQTVAPRQARK
jgi:hypothetical protein